MAKINILQRDKKAINKNAMRFWCFANIFNIIKQVKKLNYVNKRQAYIRKMIRNDPAKKEKYAGDLAKLKKVKAKNTRGTVKSCGDFLTSFNGAGKI